MKFAFPLTAAVAAVVLAACAAQPDTGKPSAEPAEASAAAAVQPAAASDVADAHSTAKSVDWPGTYVGVLPCADCSGIKTTLVLKADSTYTLTEHYQDKKETFKSKGKFSWDKKEQQVILDDKGDGRHFFVGEGWLKQYTPDGEEPTGVLADNYILKKQVAKNPGNK